MLISRKVTSAHLGLVSALVFSCLAGTTQAQSQPVSPVAEQMANMGGAMAAATLACGGIPEEQIEESKQKQQALLAKQGMDSASFERAYSAGKEEVDARWEELSQAEKDEACESMKKQAMGMM